MKIERLSEIVARWAASEPVVLRAHVFGSRVNGTQGAQSDLDVAVELRPSPGDETLLATWICEAGRLRASLAQLLPVPLDLEWYGGPDETPTIHSGLQSDSRLVFERSPDHSRGTIGDTFFCML